MIKITCDAGHGGWVDLIKKIYATSGKRTPDGTPEWEFNNKVIKAFMSYLSHYEGVAVLRVDDPTGKTDVSLDERVKRIRSWGSNAHCSSHHNAFAGKWHSGGGIETFVRTGTRNYDKSMKLAKLVHPKYVKAMGLTDRGIKTTTNLRMLSDDLGCPAILTEGGFMDSTVDIKAMRVDAKLKSQGEAIAQGFVEYFGLKKKEGTKVDEKIKLTSGQQNAVDKLVKHGMLSSNYEFKGEVGGIILTFVTILAPLLDKLEKKGSL